jgi:hypothetical protein
MSEKIWYKDLQGYLFNINNITHFIPTPNSSLVAQLNDAFRFSIYFGVIVTILKNDMRAFFFPIIVGSLTWVISSYDESTKKQKNILLEKLNVEENPRRPGDICYKPTSQNPFMNVLISDYKDFPNRPPACNLNTGNVRKEVRKLTTMPQNVDHAFDRQPIDLIFNTNPATSIPNNQGDFADWLYRRPNIKEQGVLNMSWR